MAVVTTKRVIKLILVKQIPRYTRDDDFHVIPNGVSKRVDAGCTE